MNDAGRLDRVELGIPPRYMGRRYGPVLVVRPKERPAPLRSLGCARCQPVPVLNNIFEGVTAVVLVHPCGAAETVWAWETR